MEIIKPFVRGKDVKKWKIDYDDLYLIWTYIGVSIKDYEAIKDHLDQFEEKLKTNMIKEIFGGNYVHVVTMMNLKKRK